MSQKLSGDHAKAVYDATFRALQEQGIIVREAQRSTLTAIGFSLAGVSAIFSYVGVRVHEYSVITLMLPIFLTMIVSLILCLVCTQYRFIIKEAAEKSTVLENHLREMMSIHAYTIDMEKYRPFIFHKTGLFGPELPWGASGLGQMLGAIVFISALLILIAAHNRGL